jgi:hypothetical protein
VSKGKTRRHVPPSISDLIRRRIHMHATESHAKAPGASALHRSDKSAEDAEKDDLTDVTFG